MKVITMTAWRRPDYFKEVIDSLKMADGFNEYHLIVSIDGGYPEEQKEMTDYLDNSDLNWIDYVHIENLGCAENTRFVLSKGFEVGDRVIHLEDDTMIHPDGLRWFEHNLKKYEHDERIFTISGYTNGNVNKSCLDGDWYENHLVGIRQGFHCWGWATWKRIWDEVKDDWFGCHVNDGIFTDTNGDILESIKNPKGSWGQPMNQYWRKDRYEIAPHTSFIQNIGVENGVFVPNKVFHQSRQHTDWFKPHQRLNQELDHFFVEDYLEGL